MCVLLSTLSCNFLEVERTGKNDIPKFFSDISGMRMAISGVYREFYKFYDSDYMKYSEVAADMVYLPFDFADMKSQYDYMSLPNDEKGAPGNVWEKGYSVVSNINNIMKYGPLLKDKFPKFATEIDGIMAEALFVRAITHLFICNCYGQPYNYTADGSHLGIPYIDKIPNINTPRERQSVKDVYGLVITDLNESIKLFGGLSSKGNFYASPLACQAFMARVYQYMGNWPKARDCASAVIDQKPLTKGNDYLLMFTQNSENYETIFRISGKKISNHGLRSYYYKSESVVTVSNKFVDTFYDTDDIRQKLYDSRKCLKYKYGSDYIDPSMAEEDTFYAPIVLRSSEMYMIRAEAYCHLNNADLAVKDIQAILGRTFNKAPESINVTFNGIDDLLKIIDRERILELAFEGHRFFDIIRNKQNLVRDDKTTSTVSQLSYPNDKFVLPITFIELEVNSAMVQNKGYANIR